MKTPISGGNTTRHRPVRARNITSVPRSRLTASLPAECWRRLAADAREALPRGGVHRRPRRAIAHPCSSRAVHLPSPGAVDRSQSWRKRDRDQTRVRIPLGPPVRLRVLSRKWFHPLPGGSALRPLEWVRRLYMGRDGNSETSPGSCTRSEWLGNAVSDGGLRWRIGLQRHLGLPAHRARQHTPGALTHHRSQATQAGATWCKMV